MERMRKFFGLAALSLLSVSMLVGCATYSEDDIASIEINESSFDNDWDFYVGQSVSYQTLAIDLLDNNSEVLATLDFEDYEDKITHTTIDTSALASNAVFTVTYTTESGTEFSASHTYNVVERTIDDIELVNWQMNDQYSTYLSEVDTSLDQNEDYYDENGNFDLSLVEESDYSSNSNISSEGKFYVANHNAVYLAPQTSGFAIVDGEIADIIVVEGVPDGTSLAIYAQSDTEHSENLVNSYLDDSNYQTAISTGYVDFVDDISSLETDITLVWSSTQGDGFSDISLDITLVDGWNLTEAKQLVLIDNVKGMNYSSYHTSLPDSVGESYLGLKQEVLGTTEVDSTTSFENFVLFNDITIELEDLPTGVLWQEGDTGYAEELENSLKDWYFIYEHAVGEAYGNANSEAFNFYGNYNSLILGETFPYVLSERSDYMNTETEISPDKVDTHTCLFGSDQNGFTEVKDYQINLYDATFTGNQGVADNQVIDDNGTEDEDDDLIGGGILFGKFKRDTNFINCNVNNYFTIVVTQGEAGRSTISSDYQIEINSYHSKMNNCYSSMLFIYGESDINVYDSILSNAGGPLVIVQAIDYADDNFSSVDEENIDGSNLYIDEETILDNQVTGQGGWFDLMGATSAVSNIKLISELLFEEQLQKSLLTDRGDNTDVLNLIAITMCIGNESAGALTPGMHASVEIGGNEYINYLNGYSDISNEISSILTSYSQGDLQSAMEAINNLFDDLANTPYGTQFLYYLASGIDRSAASLPAFVTYDSNGEPVFFTLDGDISEEDTKLVQVGYYVNQFVTLLNSAGISVNELEEDIPEDFADGSDYLGIYYPIFPSTDYPSIDTSSIVNILTSVSNAYSNFEGSSAYGIVLEIYDA